MTTRTLSASPAMHASAATRPAPVLVKRAAVRLRPTMPDPLPRQSHEWPASRDHRAPRPDPGRERDRRVRVTQSAPRKPAPPPKSAEDRAKIAGRTAANAEVYALLSAAFPAAFARPIAAPLAVGIRAQLRAARPDIGARDLGAFLKFWTQQDDYLDAIVHGERVNLDGSEAGRPTPDQQRAAAERVYGKRAALVLSRIRARARVAPESIGR